MLIHWIWYATRTGMGDHTKAQLLSHFESPEAIYFAEDSYFQQMEALSPEAVESLQDKNLANSQKILSDCTDLKIGILTYQDAAYPERLKNIPDPPMVLYYKGQLPSVDSEPVVGIVGTRRASPYGLTVAKRMGYQIASCGGIVVSGMAYGIDGLAMQGALTAGKSVIGVLGCGADIIYPPSNRHLFADTERYGCIMTEFPPGTPPLGRNFPRRNRIISGLSCGVLVVEAPEGSGALITARLAADQGRDVFVVPSNIDVDSARGSNALLRDGAIAVCSGADVMGEYAALYPNLVHSDRKETLLRVYPDEVKKIADETKKAALRVAQKLRKPEKKRPDPDNETKIVIDNGAQPPYIDFTKTEIKLTPDEETVWNLLAGGKRLTDDVIDESGLAAARVLSSLTMLEVKGLIRRLPGRYLERTGRN